MWPFRQKNQEEVATVEYVQYQNQVICGLEFAVSQLTSRDLEMEAIITAVMLDNGKTECVIKKDFLSMFHSNQMGLDFKINEEGNLIISLVKKEDEKKEER